MNHVGICTYYDASFNEVLILIARYITIHYEDGTRLRIDSPLNEVMLGASTFSNVKYVDEDEKKQEYVSLKGARKVTVHLCDDIVTRQGKHHFTIKFSESYNWDKLSYEILMGDWNLLYKMNRRIKVGCVYARVPIYGIWVGKCDNEDISWFDLEDLHAANDWAQRLVESNRITEANPAVVSS